MKSLLSNALQQILTRGEEAFALGVNPHRVSRAVPVWRIGGLGGGCIRKDLMIILCGLQYAV